MFREMAKLLVFHDLGEDRVLNSFRGIWREWEEHRDAKGQDWERFGKTDLVGRIHNQANQILNLATRYGLSGNLWCGYLAYRLAMSENPFTLFFERTQIGEGDVIVDIAKQDCRILYELIHYDFKPIEESLGVQCLSMLKRSHILGQRDARKRMNGDVSEKVTELSGLLEKAKDGGEVYAALSGFYQNYGVGTLGMHTAFRIASHREGVKIQPITSRNRMDLDELIGYDAQKRQLLDNTEAFVKGRKANNVLLYGDGGTGKSSCVQAILNRYSDQGLRVIEVFKHQCKDLTSVMERIKDRNYKFILYMDDLSFEEFEIGYKYLKAVIEGGLEAKPDNVLIYATSNRRHLIRETWSDRSDMSQDELHHSDTMQEKLSLVGRFGVLIHFPKPSQKEYFRIVIGLARRNPRITLPDEELVARANRWSMRNGGLSGRTAVQFVTYLESML